MQDKFYTTIEIAEMLRISRNTVFRHIQERKLAATVIGRVYRISESQLADYLKANTIQPMEKPQ